LGNATKVTLASGNIVGGSGFANPLDGNQNPPGTDGQEPNSNESYVVNYTCGAGLNLFVSGQVDGQATNGQIQVAGSQITCTPLTVGGSSVHWNGLTPDNVSVGGDWSMKYGTWPVGDQVGAAPANFSLINPKLTTVGASSGSVTINANGGSI